MTTVEPAIEQTLGELVTAHPGAAPVLEDLGIDYCCHGARSLSEAAAAAGHDASEVLARILATEGTPETGDDYRTMTMSELTEHIECTHHAFLHAELPRLIELTAKIAAVHGDRHPELIRVAELAVALHDDMEPHMAKEEQVLFPMIRSLEAGTTVPVEHPIAQMMREHEATGEILEQLRQITGGYEVPADGCATYTATYQALEKVELDTHLHIHKENNVLFPAAVARS